MKKGDRVWVTKSDRSGEVPATVFWIGKSRNGYWRVGVNYDEPQRRGGGAQTTYESKDFVWREMVHPMMDDVRGGRWIAVVNDGNQEGDAIHVYEDERTARAHAALNEYWDGEVRVQPIGNTNMGNKPVITYASLEDHLRRYHLI